jgi:hypothetical protein
MKAILEFNLPEEQPEFDNAVNGAKWSLVAWKLDQWLRSQIKYSPDDMSQEAYEAFEECRDKLHEIKNEYSLSFD